MSELDRTDLESASLVIICGVNVYQDDDYFALFDDERDARVQFMARRRLGQFCALAQIVEHP